MAVRAPTVHALQCILALLATTACYANRLSVLAAGPKVMSDISMSESSCEWRDSRCVPTYAQLFQQGAPRLQSFSASSFARTQAYKYVCSQLSQNNCAQPCVWNQESGCSYDTFTAGFYTLSCKGSQVNNMASCGFDSLLTPGPSGAAQCRKRGACSVKDNTCTASFFQALVGSKQGDRAGTAWYSSMLRGDPSSWGCCAGSRLYRRLAACSTQPAGMCSPRGDCVQEGSRCLMRAEATARILFGDEATSDSAEEAVVSAPGGNAVLASSSFARELLGMWRTCAPLSYKQCGQYKPVQIDRHMVTSYLYDTLRNQQFEVEVCRADEAAAAGAVASQQQQEEDLAVALLRELDQMHAQAQRPGEDEDVVF
eukprot:CAMPEP_0202924162 /NCGR_PEP_ID=MMETSP1392-20130828/78828_1 /ASSEMBLY_ACC=CAM_ASM_000868 /TAXON_ID=225041 /ORGANISM="Chlamydomonas chlamydogama, Strain SAG 11-48b" /LENGTH=368 /DNA_ID=CAMNT_0049617877 /DNA_START=74 /DNA_END=1180 /DNA_ORIENTATION=-